MSSRLILIDDVESERRKEAWAQPEDKIRAFLYRGYRTEAMLYAASTYKVSWSEALSILTRFDEEIASS